MGTEQENTGLSETELTEAEEKALYASAFNAISKGVPMEIEEEQKTPESTPEPQETQPEPENTAASPAANETPKEESAPQPVLPEDIHKRLKELEEERDRLKHERDSAKGRAIAFQNKSEQALQELQRQRAAQQTASQPSAQKSKIKDSEEWKLLQENDPVTARLLENFREETLRQAEEIARSNVKTAIEPFEQTFNRQESQKAQEELYKLVPNLDEVKESEPYKEWWFAQDESVHNLGFNPKGVYRIMQLYAADMNSTHGAKKEEPAPVANTPAPVVIPAVVNDIQKERERKLQGQGVTSKTTAPPTELSDEALFNKAYKDNLRRIK